MTAFAGSIGIIGIALILALSNGVNIYITDIQKSTMTAYPISIQEESIDMTSMLGSVTPHNTDKLNHALDGVYSNGESVEKASQAATSIVENNLTAFKNIWTIRTVRSAQYVGKMASSIPTIRSSASIPTILMTSCSIPMAALCQRENKLRNLPWAT